jgi:hypothetical protein
VSYSYHAYGFGIDSFTSIAGLSLHPRDLSSIDLQFESGPQPEWVSRAKKLPARLLSHLPTSENPPNPSFVLNEYGSAQCYHFAYSDGTQFAVDGHARRIWGTVEPPLTEEDLATYFLGPVMGFVLRQRHITALHASAIDVAGQAVAFCGDAGYGKSTTAAALALRGRPVLSEDIVPLREQDSGFHAIPGYPRICLWPDSVAGLLGSSQALPQLTPVWGKRYLPLDGVRAHFASQQLPLALIYLFSPRSQDANAPRIEDVRPRVALLELVQNTYMNWLLDRERRAVEFDTLVRLVYNVPVRRIIAHADSQKIALLCDLILRDAENVLSRNPTPSDSVLG